MPGLASETMKALGPFSELRSKIRKDEVWPESLDEAGQEIFFVKSHESILSESLFQAQAHRAFFTK